jgi:hypothetical protein
LEARIAKFEEAQATAALHAEVARLQAKYGEDFNPQEVVAAAVQSQSSDLEATFKTIAFDRIVARQNTKATKVAKVDDDKVAAKRAVGDVVSNGGSAKGSIPDSSPIRSISDAYRAAKRSHGA